MNGKERREEIQVCAPRHSACHPPEANGLHLLTHDNIGVLKGDCVAHLALGDIQFPSDQCSVRDTRAPESARKRSQGAQRSGPHTAEDAERRAFFPRAHPGLQRNLRPTICRRATVRRRYIAGCRRDWGRAVEVLRFSRSQHSLRAARRTLRRPS